MIKLQRLAGLVRSVAPFALLLVRSAAALAQDTGQLIQTRVHAVGLERNRLGDAADQVVHIYLPPSYQAAPMRRYPVLYLLHGYSGRPEEWTTNGYQGMSLQSVMDSLLRAGLTREMIVVVPNGRNRYLGSFYTNSPVTGNWDDYIAKELVAHVDASYRTIARRESRGIAGHSMGGYGAISLAMRHPDVFGAVSH
jgi:S-formylglutathione hydrolase FrmB